MFAVALLMQKQVFAESVQGEISTRRKLEIARHFGSSVAAPGMRYAELRGVAVFAYEDSRVIWGKGIGPAKQTSLDGV